MFIRMIVEMQRVIFLLFACSLLGCQTMASIATNSSANDVNDTASYDPLQLQKLNIGGKIEKLVQQHLADDNGFKAAIVYLQGDEWKSLVKRIFASPEYKRFVNIGLPYKINITEVFVHLRERIDAIPMHGTNGSITSKPDLDYIFRDLKEYFGLEEVIKQFAVKKNDPGVKKIRELIGTSENKKIAEELFNQKDVQKLTEILRRMNFDVAPYIGLAFTALGWS